MNKIAPERERALALAAYEHALIGLVNATDGHGNAVRLLGPGSTGWKATDLRDATFNFMQNFDKDAMFITLDAAGKPVESQQSEIAAWENLALLARATAAALRVELTDPPAVTSG